MRILDKYIYKELYSTFFAVLTVLLLITLGTEVTRLLADAVRAEIPPSVVFQVVLYKIPPVLEIILPLVALLSVMLVIGRLHQDQEMAVLSSCGVDENYFKKRVFWFLLPLAILTGWVSLYVTPWSSQQERNIISSAEKTSPLAFISSGKFSELPNNKGIFFTKTIQKDKTIKDIWIKLHGEEQNLILIAPSGKFEWVDERPILVLFNGISYQGLEKGQEFNLRKFKQFEAFLPEIKTKPRSKSKYAYSNSQLWESEDIKQNVLLQWRIMAPFSLIVLGLFALKLSKTKPREGRFTKIFVALVFYIIFSQLLVVNKEMLLDGKIPLFVGLWTIPIIFLLYSLKRSAR